MNTDTPGPMDKGEAVVVTTAHRGIFFGYLEEERDRGRTVVLADARNAIYYAAATLGFLGLADKGPGSGCRIGPSVCTLILYEVTSVATCTAIATDAWEAAPWSK